MDGFDAVHEDGDSNVHDPLNLIVPDGENEDEALTAHEDDLLGEDNIESSAPANAAVPNVANVTAIDTVEMLEGAAPSEGVFLGIYVWDAMLRQASQWPTQSLTATAGRCSKCSTLGCRVNVCPYPSYTMRVHACKYYGTVLLGKEKNGICCGKSFLKRISFRRQEACI
jgi:hypothetical protein